MDGYAILLSTLVALLAGLAIGKAWERYKLRDGQWIDRRRARESPHYMLGLNFLVTNQTERAIDELTRAAATAGDPLEIHLILGNLYREKGQVGRAIQEHQNLLQRPDLRKLEHANVLLCLGLDYKRGGFVDRALEAFTEVLRLDPDNQYALSNLEKLYEEQHQWAEAYATRRKLARRDTDTSQSRHQEILAFLENELGLDALKRMDYAEAARRFEAAIELDERTVPAYLNLGDVHFYQGDTAAAIAKWERLIDKSPERAYLVFARLEGAYPKINDPGRFPALCRRLIDANPQDWRARLALARHLSSRDGSPGSPRDPVRSARAQPARAGAPSGHLAHALDPRPAASARHALRRPDARRRLLPRPAHLHPLPLSQHGAALAVPAVPRVEYVYRGEDCAGERKFEV